LAGLLKPDFGALVPSAPEPGDVGLVFQEPANQLFAQTVYDDVAFGPQNLKLAESRAGLDRIVRKALTAVGLNYELFAGLNPLNLSGGQARRVAIAGVLALDTEVVLFDEPTAGLDASGVLQLLKLIIGLLNEKKAVAVVSHDVEVFAQLASTTIELDGAGSGGAQ
jgi:energy-coupling factor transport system ATP-binding protein